MKVQVDERKTLGILICTYNSANTIKDTLNSLIGQKTENVELIVSDDASQDQTVQFVEEWMEENREAFKSCKLLKADTNTGVSANASRGMEALSSDFVKILAGDDIFAPGCIDTILQAINMPENENAGILVGKLYQFTSDDSVYNVEKQSLTCPYEKSIFEESLVTFATATETKIRLKNLTTVAPGTVFSLKTYNELGGFERKYRNFEDLPYFLKLMRHGAKFAFIDDYIVYYRKSSKALTNRSGASQYTNLNFYRDYDKFYWQELRPMQRKYGNIAEVIDGDLSNIRTRMIVRFGKNKKGFVYKITKPLVLLTPAMLKNIKNKIIKEK